MKHFLPLFVCLLAYAPHSFAQGTCKLLNDASESQFCDACNDASNPRRDIVNNNSELDGTLDVNNNSSVGINAYLPLSCGETGPITIGDLNIILGEGESLVIDPSVGISAAAVEFDVAPSFGTSNASITFRGTTYQIGGDGSGPTFGDLIAQVRAEAQALPVDLYYWKAKSEPEGVQLKWASSSETDNDYYSIEYSTDGRHFTEIARVDGRGSSDGVVRYKYTDVPTEGDTHYYRLVQQDFDGTRETFAVRSVSFGSAATLATVYPNPARAGQRVTFQAPANVAEVVLHSITGREIQRSPATNGTVDLPATLPSGIYVLRAGTATTRLLVR